MKDKKTFSCNDNGFAITFPNGLTLSTRFGYGNYCENHDNEKQLESFRQPFLGLQSDNVEVAIIKKDGGFIAGENGDTVKGYVEIDEWLEVFKWCQNHRSE